MKTIYLSKIEQNIQNEFFCLYGDLTNFSKLSKDCLSEDVSIKCMKMFYELCFSNINKSNGLLLSFMGDGFLCIWEKGSNPSQIISTIKAITSETAELVTEWKKSTNGIFDLPLGIKFGGAIANITLFLSCQGKIVNSFGNQLNMGARLQSAKENKSNCICITSAALEWLKFTKPIKGNIINVTVKDDSYSAIVLPIASL